MDEFRGADSKLHSICINCDGNHEIQKTLPNRFKKDILAYFDQFPPSVRKRVKIVTLDLNSHYQDIAKLMFPNAKIIIDRFHIVAMMTRSFNQTQAQALKKYDKKSLEYLKLKFALHLYLKYSDKLDKTQLFYDRHLRQQLTQLERVEFGLAVDDQLSASYTAMQGIMKSLKDHDKDKIIDYLYNSENLRRQMQDTLNTFKKKLEVVLMRVNQNTLMVQLKVSIE